MTDLRVLTSRLISSPGPSKLRSDDGLALSYYPGDEFNRPLVVAGRVGAYPARQEERAIIATIKRCVGVEFVGYSTRMDRPGGYCLAEFRWRPNTAVNGAGGAAVAGRDPAVEVAEPAAEVGPVTVYMACYLGVEDGRYDIHTIGVSTSRSEAEGFGRRSGIDGWRVAETELYPKPVKITHGMRARRYL